MIRLLLPVLIILGAFTSLTAQLNATLISNLDFESGVNDVWGYVAPDGTEYALVGLNVGIAIVSLADPAAPELIVIDSLPSVTWRDIKTYGSYAYVGADGPNATGMTVIDLSGLPDRVSSETYTYGIPESEAMLVRAHNVYVDTTSGLLFSSGDNGFNRGGVVIFDLKANPAQPRLVALGPAEYAHDVYVQDTFLYTSEIYKGELGIYSIADLDSIYAVGATRTPFSFTHNAWTNEEQTVVFTTDEKANASVAAYDISNLKDIKLLDEYRPLTSLNSNTIPHNVHVIDGYLSISYYTDGLRVVDASVPDNLVEVANYDTYLGPNGDFWGAWGAYPFLPSGLTLVSDRQSGLSVVDVNYKRAARITGTVRAADSDTPLLNARVQILTNQANTDRTDATGKYATGVADAGTYQVEASGTGYYPDTVTLSLENGQTTIQDFSLSERKTGVAQATLVEKETGRPVVGALVEFYNRDISYVTISDDAGSIRYEDIYDYDYQAIITAWGYQFTIVDGLQGDELDGSDTIFLERGYEDVFITDLGWTVSGNATKGRWERGVPQYTINGDGPGQSDTDSPRDYGRDGYFTGLRAARSNDNDVDKGTTTLTSPIIDLTEMGKGAVMTYDYWFSNIDGANPNDSMTVAISNGDTTQLLAVYRGRLYQWNRDTIELDGVIPFTDSMRVIVSVTDKSPDHLVEGAFDNFRILDSLLLSPVVNHGQESTIKVAVYPNPSASQFSLDYDLGTQENAWAEVYSLTGRRISEVHLTSTVGKLNLGADWAPGVYLVRFVTRSGRPLSVHKLVKL